MKTEYKGFNIEITKDIWKYYNSKIIIFKNKGYKEEEFYSEEIPNYNKNIKDCLKETKKTIDLLINKGIPFISNGKINAYYLPSIKDKEEVLK